MFVKLMVVWYDEGTTTYALALRVRILMCFMGIEQNGIAHEF
mgnify:CR=1 FL=1